MRYDAFISYRHAELDMFVAKKVHKGLETFKVPRSVVKKTGKKNIKRVFRDQEELPIGSDLGGNIEAALRESEYLIVICSPRTPESYWVQKEIETFISMHGREHVLAILIEGEPNESFPQMLTVDEAGNPVEPLAADVRGKSKGEVKKKLKTEIMRLAAPLLSCSYDDLRQRHKERFMKKVIAAATGVAALAISFGVYSAYNTMMIQKNYEGKQINQSKYMADTSQQLLELGNRRLAALIALEALPTEGNDRPYVASAQYALGESLNIYDTGNRVGMDYNFEHDTPVTDISFNKDGTKLLTIDQNDYVYVWDVADYSLLAKIPPNYSEMNQVNSIIEAKMDLQDNIIIYDNHGIRSVRLDGTENWSIETEEYQAHGLIDVEAGIAACSEVDILKFYDLKTGNVIVEFVNDIDASFSATMVFNQKKDLFVINRSGDIEATTGMVSVVDLKAKEMRHYEVMPSSISEIVFTSDDNVVVAGEMKSELFDLNNDGIINGYVQKIDRFTGTTLWMNSYEYLYIDVDGTSTKMKARAYVDKETAVEHKEVFLSVNNSAYTWDADTGECIAEIKMTNGITDMLVMVDRSLGYLAERSGTINLVDITTGERYTSVAIETGKKIKQVLIQNGIIAICSFSTPDVTLMKCHEGYGKEELESFENTIDEIYYSEDETYYCVCIRETENAQRCHFYHTDSNEKLATWTPEAGYSYVGTQFVGNTFVTVNRYGVIEFYDVETKQEESLSLGDSLYSVNCYFTRNARFALLTTTRRCFVVDLEQRKVIFSKEFENTFRGAILAEDGKKIYAYIDGMKLCKVSIETDDIQPITQEEYEVRFVVGGEQAMTISDDGTLLAVNCRDNMLRILNLETMSTVAEIPLAARYGCYMQFSDDNRRIFMQGDDLYLRIYSIEAQEFIFIASWQNNKIQDISCNKEIGNIYVGTTGELMLLNEEDYGLLAVIDDGVAYFPLHKRVLCNYYNELYQFPYMTLDMLLEEAKVQFGDAVLTKQERMQYNID